MKTRIAILLIILLAVASCVYGQDRLDKPTSMSRLFAIAIELGGFKDACKQREWRGGCPQPSLLITALDDDTLGVFDYSIEEVRLNRDLVPGSLQFNAVAIHEMVHYLQFLTGTLSPANSCEQHVAQELQAYDVTAAYYAKFGIAKDFSSQRFMLKTMCMAA